MKMKIFLLPSTQNQLCPNAACLPLLERTILDPYGRE